MDTNLNQQPLLHKTKPADVMELPAWIKDLGPKQMLELQAENERTLRMGKISNQVLANWHSRHTIPFKFVLPIRLCFPWLKDSVEHRLGRWLLLPLGQHFQVLRETGLAHSENFQMPISSYLMDGFQQLYVRLVGLSPMKT
ncbi:hypothetical protein L873DRAFT_197946 [Choiromyces venosus 120613-1]|uniref:Uncharacterized protein n=1 Tax=Choiromyces venosus 120613-1 TaxID=1336337 RepID=A0A3N4J6T4_9PEZI|nr:hypothetical protein L873DRAFT_197946 [Choiromyces venosus 120613-1]